MSDMNITEQAALSPKGNKYRIRLLSEGVGSSGTYPADVIKRDGPMAWPVGTQLFLDHLTESDEWDRAGNHSIKDLVGVTLTDPVWDESDKGLYAEARFFETALPFIQEAKDYIGLSVEAKGVISDGIVEAIHFSPLNAIAIIPRAGRDGKITELIESYREKRDKIDNGTPLNESAGSEEGKDQGMTPEEIAELRESVTKAVTEAIAAGLTEIKESLAAPPADNEETDEPNVAAVTEAIVASGLPESARKRVYESMKVEGADVTALIANEKAYIADLTESLKEDAEEEIAPGRIREAAGNKDVDFSVAGWSK